MKGLICMALVAMFALAGCTQDKDEQQIRDMLGAQVAEWNKGNIEGYMIGYWEHDSLVFIGKRGPTYGYQATLERYKKGYPNAEAMGRLTSTILSLKRLSDKYYFVIGEWHLSRKDGDLSGSYTLLLEKIGGKWVIINDHSS